MSKTNTRLLVVWLVGDTSYQTPQTNSPSKMSIFFFEKVFPMSPTLFPRRDKKGLHWTPLTTVPKKFHYFSNLKNVFKTWFRRPTNDLIELCFLWFYMCFCKKNHLNRYFETLYGLFSSWWPNRVIIWYFEPKKPKISVFWGIVCFVATFLQVLICKITRKTTWKNHKKGSTG